MSPHLLCVLAVTAALVAATAGHLCHPHRRARRALRRRLAALAHRRNLLAGRLAVRPEWWIVFWYDTKLDDLPLWSEIAPDSLNGGA